MNMHSWFILALAVLLEAAAVQASSNRQLLSRVKSEGFSSDGAGHNLRVQTSGKPEDLDPNGLPVHYSYTRPPRPIRVAVFRVRFNDADAIATELNARSPPYTIVGDIDLQAQNRSMIGVRQWFLDSSWGALDMDFFHPPTIQLSQNAADMNAGQIQTATLAEAENTLGLYHCWGTCGTPTAKPEFQDASYATNSNYYDHVVILFRQKSSGEESSGWSGIAQLGNPMTTIKIYEDQGGVPAGASGFVTAHEFGHSYGIGHPQSAKLRNGKVFYCRSGADYSIMALGGYDTYINNGHFSASHKHWYGWLTDDNVVFMHPEGSSVNLRDGNDCPRCQATFTGKINAFDRPDVVPGEETSPYFAVAVPVRKTSGREENLYISYRSSNVNSRTGLNVQFCYRDYSTNDARMSSNCYSYDVIGDTWESNGQGGMEDGFITAGQTYVVSPSWTSVDRAGLKAALSVVPQITVTSVPDFSDCPDMVCPDNKEIAVGVEIRFLSEQEKALRVGINPPAARTFSVTPGNPLDFSSPSGGGRVLIIAEDEAKGAQGEGEFRVTVCPKGNSNQATVTFYDHFPYGPTRLGQPLGMGASYTKSVIAADCCEAGEMIPATRARALILRQNLRESISMGEIEVYNTANPNVNFNLGSNCYMLPRISWSQQEGNTKWYTGNLDTGIDPYLNDGNMSPKADGGQVKPDGVGGEDYMMCIFAQDEIIDRVRIRPVHYGLRNADLSLQLYSEVEADPSPEEEKKAAQRPKASSLVWETRILKGSANWEAGEDFFPAGANAQRPCPGGGAGPLNETYPSAHGQAYAVVELSHTGFADITAHATYTTCPSNPTHNDADPPLDINSYQITESNGDHSCKLCPEYPVLAIRPECPPRGKSCLIYRTDDGLISPVAGTSPTQYSGPGQSGITFNAATRNWELKRADGVLVATKQTEDLREPWKETGAAKGVGGYVGINAVTVTTVTSNTLNFCEIEVYDENGVNRAPEATCWNLPAGQGGPYSGGVDGLEPEVNDGAFGDACRGMHAGSAAVGLMLACIFPTAIKPTNVSMYPRHIYKERIDDVDITFYTDIPAGTPTTETFTSRAFAARMPRQNMGVIPFAKREICALDFSSAWAIDPAVSGPDCAETRSIQDLLEAADVGTVMVKEGGLGRLAYAGYEVWICVLDNQCVQNHAPANPPSDINAPAGWKDWMCYVYDENAEIFEPWGFNSELRLFDPTYQS